jgi:hypothetical protein
VTRGWIVVKVAMTGRKSGLFQKSPRVSNGMPWLERCGPRWRPE